MISDPHLRESDGAEPVLDDGASATPTRIRNLEPDAVTAGRSDERSIPMPITRLPALDGLRGIAVILVIVGHLWPTTLPGGFVGVSVFFALSGYLITSLILQEVEHSGQHLALGRFWSRRIRRLAPAAIIVLVCSLLATRIWPQASGGPWEFVAASTHWLNLRYAAAGVTYGQDTIDPSAIQHFWSLAIEEQFYLVYPLLAAVAAWGARRWRWSIKLVLAVPLAAVTGLSVVIGQVVSPGSAYYRTDLRMGELAIGCLAALSFPLGAERSAGSGSAQRWLGSRSVRQSVALVSKTWFADALGAIGLGFIIGSAVSLDVDEPRLYTVGFSLLAVASVLILVSIRRGRIVKRILAVPALAWTGRVSYGLYLLHWPLLVFANRAFPQMGIMLRSVLVLGLTISIAAASYRFIEMPIRRGKFVSRPVPVYLTTLVAVGALVFVVPPSVYALKFGAQVTDLSAGSNTAGSGETTAIVTGDSVLWSAMWAMPPDEDVNVMRLLLPGCPFLEDLDGLVEPEGSGENLARSDFCLNWTRTIDMFATKDPDVVLFSAGNSLARTHLASGAGVCSAEFDRWYTARLKATITTLKQVAPLVVLLPHRSFAPDSFDYLGIADYPENMMCIRGIQQRLFVQFPDIEVIDFESYLCPGGTEGCVPAELWDGIHFHSERTAGIVAWIKEIIIENGS